MPIRIWPDAGDSQGRSVCFPIPGCSGASVWNLDIGQGEDLARVPCRHANPQSHETRNIIHCRKHTCFIGGAAVSDPCTAAPDCRPDDAARIQCAKAAETPTLRPPARIIEQGRERRAANGVIRIAPDQCAM